MTRILVFAYGGLVAFLRALTGRMNPLTRPRQDGFWRRGSGQRGRPRSTARMMVRNSVVTPAASRLLHAGLLRTSAENCSTGPVEAATLGHREQLVT